MRPLIFSLLICQSVGFGAAPLEMVAELRDGSRFIGSVALERTTFVAAYGTMTLDMRQVAVVTFEDDAERVKLEMKNGDRLQGVLDLPGFKINTILGELTIPVPQIARIIFAKLPPQAATEPAPATDDAPVDPADPFDEVPPP